MTPTERSRPEVYPTLDAYQRGYAAGRAEGKAVRQAARRVLAEYDAAEPPYGFAGAMDALRSALGEDE